MIDPTTHKHPSRIPEFANLEEEAACWDTHNTTDFEDEFHPVNVVFEEHLSDAPPSKRTAIRLDAETDRELSVLAQQQGLRKSALVRSVVRHYLPGRHVVPEASSLRCSRDENDLGPVPGSVPQIGL